VTTTYFYDAVTPANIPDGSDACLYVDGDFAAPPAAWKRFARTRGITVLGGAPAAANAGCADFERLNAVYDDPGRLTEYVDARLAMGCLARVYASRSNFAKAYALVGHQRCVRWWVPTLDGHELTAAELASSIHDEAGIDVPLELLWGQQVWGGVTAKFDKSVLYGTW
jgi:hypothetical protein